MKLHEAEESIIALRECSNEEYRLSKGAARLDNWGVEVKAPTGKWVPLTENQINTIIGM